MNNPPTELRKVIDEFGRHLDMLGEQLGASILEADRECVSVGESFQELAAAKLTIEGVRCHEPDNIVLHHSCRQIDGSLRNAVIALQYHDRFAQRLDLIKANLNRLRELLQETSPRSYDDWLRALRAVEDLNRIEQRRLGPALSDRARESSSDSGGAAELF